METKEEENSEKDYELTLDFSKQSLRRVERAQKEHESVTTLMLDYNEIQKLHNMETYHNLKKLSLVGNQLIRMYSVSVLTNLVELDLSQNSLVAIEGLKDMTNLKILKLASNKIKTIEHLNNNLNLEVLDLSDNNILRISDISHLINLQELYLHENKIVSLSHSEKKLPVSLKVLTLHSNNLTDLNEVSNLSCLTSLKKLTLANNPCLHFSDKEKLNYRPFIKNWCCNLIVLDNCPLDDIECLKAEWLYSQGRGRSFKVGEHAALIEYLLSVCPREKEENAETEDVKKLKLILSKAQLYQQQLREQLASGEIFKSSFKKRISGVPERMVSSFQDSSAKDVKNSNDLMTQSLDSGIVRKTIKVSKGEPNQTPLQTSTSFIPIPDTLISPDVGLPTAMKTPPFSTRSSRPSSRNSPHSTPENKRKTSCARNYCEKSPIGPKVGERLTNSTMSAPADEKNSSRSSFDKRANKSKASIKSNKETSEEDDSEALKSHSLRFSQRKNKILNSRKVIHTENIKTRNTTHVEGKENNRPCESRLVDDNEWKAAVCIQRRWRGYRTRNLNREVLSGCKSIQMDRIQNYLRKVLTDMETTKVVLEGNRKLVMLQMQAINALWKKTTGLAVGSQSEDNKTTIQDLVETCTILNRQVEALQIMVKNLQSSGPPPSVPIATQTEISAVHTPQDETRIIFPYNRDALKDGISLDSIEFKENISETDKSSIPDSRGTIITESGEINEDIPLEASSNLEEKLSQLTRCITNPIVLVKNSDGEFSNELKEFHIKSQVENSCES